MSAPDVARLLLARKQWLATAESCTGGLIAQQLTDLPGSSAWFECGIVCYSNRAKMQLLQVPPALLEQHGAVSEAVVLAMAQGLLHGAPVDWTIAVTGIAGPSGGSAGKPVGTVWIAWAERAGAVQAQRFQFGGDRRAVREASAAAALAGLVERLA